ncbi:MAG: hypothetical protein JW793_12950 [Acidobacteria bacterium]|nr:hypothetical protein [Acidobacteriota bacterium]
MDEEKRRRIGLRTLPYHIALNAAYYGRVVRWEIKGYDPARRTAGMTGEESESISAAAAGARHAAPLSAGNAG